MVAMTEDRGTAAPPTGTRKLVYDAGIGLLFIPAGWALFLAGFMLSMAGASIPSVVVVLFHLAVGLTLGLVRWSTLVGVLLGLFTISGGGFSGALWPGVLIAFGGVIGIALSAARRADQNRFANTPGKRVSPATWESDA
jgi:hypothetical protein